MAWNSSGKIYPDRAVKHVPAMQGALQALLACSVASMPLPEREDGWTFRQIKQCRCIVIKKFSLRLESPKSHTCDSHHLVPEPSSPSEALWLHSLGFTEVESSCLAVSFTLGESECQLQNASTWHQFPVKNFCGMVLASSELTPEKVFPVMTNWRKSHTMYYFLPAKHLVQNHISLLANSLT